MSAQTSKKKSVEDLLEEISKKMDLLISTQAVQGKDRDEQAKVYREMGMSYTQVSALTGIPSGTLKWRESQKKKKVKK